MAALGDCTQDGARDPLPTQQAPLRHRNLALRSSLTAMRSWRSSPCMRAQGRYSIQVRWLGQSMRCGKNSPPSGRSVGGLVRSRRTQWHHGRTSVLAKPTVLRLTIAHPGLSCCHGQRVLSTVAGILGALVGRAALSRPLPSASAHVACRCRVAGGRRPCPAPGKPALNRPNVGPSRHDRGHHVASAVLPRAFGHGSLLGLGGRPADRRQHRQGDTALPLPATPQRRRCVADVSAELG